jgi:hypothetical protein
LWWEVVRLVVGSVVTVVWLLSSCVCVCVCVCVCAVVGSPSIPIPRVRMWFSRRSASLDLRHPSFVSLLRPSLCFTHARPRTVDSVGKTPAEQLRANPPFLPSVPTPINFDQSHAAPMRLDYMLATDTVFEFEVLSCSIIHSADTHSLSDHYPIVAVLRATLSR